MTNYEWLIKTGKLNAFLADIEAMRFRGNEIELYEKYSIPASGTFPFNFSAWLQDEHTGTHYFKVKDVFDIIYAMKTEYMLSMEASSILDNIENALNNCPIKEIDDD